MTEESSNRLSRSELVSTGKELVAMLRDAMLLVMAVLLLVWPQTIKRVLMDAGFKKGSIAGMEWEANFSESDETLLKAQSTISDLLDQNGKLNKTLSEIKSQIGNTADIAKLEQINTQLVANAAKVQVSAAANILANAPLVQEIQTSTDKAITWGVVYGGDQKLDRAEHEIKTTAPKFGLSNAAIYYRQGSFRSVATTIDRLQASQLLNKAKEHRKDAYIVNMSTWCPNVTQKEGYFECSNS
jgi:hypothetical protein